MKTLFCIIKILDTGAEYNTELVAIYDNADAAEEHCEQDYEIFQILSMPLLSEFEAK